MFCVQQLSTELISKPDFTSRIQHAVEVLHTGSNSTAAGRSELEKAANSFYQKLMAADKYQPEGKLRGTRVQLVKASSGYEQAQVLGDDYGLSKVSLAWCYAG